MDPPPEEEVMELILFIAVSYAIQRILSSGTPRYYRHR